MKRTGGLIYKSVQNKRHLLDPRSQGRFLIKKHIKSEESHSDLVM